jgi:hypothetical protein
MTEYKKMELPSSRVVMDKIEEVAEVGWRRMPLELGRSRIAAMWPI